MKFHVEFPSLLGQSFVEENCFCRVREEIMSFLISYYLREINTWNRPAAVPADVSGNILQKSTPARSFASWLFFFLWSLGTSQGMCSMSIIWCANIDQEHWVGITVYLAPNEISDHLHRDRHWVDGKITPQPPQKMSSNFCTKLEF